MRAEKTKRWRHHTSQRVAASFSDALQTRSDPGKHAQTSWNDPDKFFEAWQFVFTSPQTISTVFSGPAKGGLAEAFVFEAGLAPFRSTRMSSARAWL